MLLWYNDITQSDIGFYNLMALLILTNLVCDPTKRAEMCSVSPAQGTVSGFKDLLISLSCIKIESTVTLETLTLKELLGSSK